MKTKPSLLSRVVLSICLALLSFSAASSARAATEQPIAEPAMRDIAVTISPLHLFLPVLELTGEVRAADWLGLAVVLGGGRATSDEDIGGERLEATVYEVGAQVRFYAVGDFRHGLQLGAEALYVRLAGDVQDVRALGRGVAIGPFAGYKYTADGGFTFDAQLGVQRTGLAAEATDGAQSATAEENDWIVLLNLNVGWSF